MTHNGIYLLANDNVYEQLLALLNSIEANYRNDIPVCIIPFDENIEKIGKEIKTRKNVFLFSDLLSLQKWDNFISKWHELYQTHFSGLGAKTKTNLINMHRRYCAFDGPFERFIYIDSDTLVFQPLDIVFQKLDDYDFIVHDFQRETSLRRKEVSHFFENFQQVYKSEKDIYQRFHCSGFWASKRGAINDNDLDYFLQELANGDVNIFKTWLSEQLILNYMTLKKGLKLYNFTLDENSEYNTGVCITSAHFEEKNHILYDRGKKLTYLHYMGVKNERLRRLCQWEKMNLPYKNKLVPFVDKLFKSQMGSIPYKEIFLYYRFRDNR